ncbi:MAG: hypothetical protein QOH96_1567 [Blastocatellia bacterium]|nr:hypothetical protein [Blastocatellia bacterium]
MYRSLFSIFFILILCASCRMVDTLTGGEKAGTVDSLWSDVPPIQGASRSDMALPLGARLAIRAAMQGKVSFIAFTTSRSPQEVQSFYSNDRMKSAGWNPNEKGCVTDTESKVNQGAICVYDRKDGDKKEGLFIVLAQDLKKKETDIFYARIDLTEAKIKESKP